MNTRFVCFVCEDQNIQLVVFSYFLKYRNIVVYYVFNILFPNNLPWIAFDGRPCLISSSNHVSTERNFANQLCTC